MTEQKESDAGSHASNTHKNTSTDTNTTIDVTNTQVANPTVPLILSFLACILFGISIIIAGYIHGNMHINAVYHSLTAFV